MRLFSVRTDQSGPPHNLVGMGHCAQGTSLWIRLDTLHFRNARGGSIERHPWETGGMMTKGVSEQNDRSGSAFCNTTERAKGIKGSEQAAPQNAILMAPIPSPHTPLF